MSDLVSHFRYRIRTTGGANGKMQLRYVISKLLLIFLSTNLCKTFLIPKLNQNSPNDPLRSDEADDGNLNTKRESFWDLMELEPSKKSSKYVLT